MSSAQTSHERQADNASRLFIRGGRSLQRSLTPAAAAGVHVPGSPGQGLPSALRADLELAFEADLGVVRIHSDAESARAAEGYRARAFATGAHIFMSAGEYQPFSPAGRSLIAHEVAHVLQQTGRRTSHGRLAATEISGAGDVQCAPTFDVMRSLHGGKQEDAKFRAIADELVKIAGDKAKIEKYIETHRNEMPKWSDGALGLVFDVAKAAGAYAAAAGLIDLDDFKGGLRIRTSFYSQAFEEELVKLSVGTWIFERAINRFSDLKLYRSEWLRMIEMFLLQPLDRKTPPLLRNLDPNAGAKSKDWESIQKHFDAAKAYPTGELSPNEWYLRGLDILTQVNDWRISACNTARQKVEQKEASRPWNRRRALVEQLRGWAKGIAETKFTNDEARTTGWKPFFQALSDDVIKILDAVDATWVLTIDFIQLDIQVGHDESRSTDDYKLQRNAQLKLAADIGLGTTLAAIATALNASDAKNNRIPADYVDRSRQQGLVLQRLLAGKIEDNLLYWFRKKDSLKLIAGLVIVRQCENLRRVLDWRWNPFVVAVGSSPKVGTEPVSKDRVIAHRILAAQEVRRTAADLGLKTAVAAAEEILEARREAESQLVLLPDEKGVVWHRSEVAPQKLTSDFSEYPFKGSEPLTAYEYLLLYHTEYLDRLWTALSQVLPKDAAGEKRAIASGTSGIVQSQAKKVRTEIEASGLTPQRWSVLPESGSWRRTFFAGKPGKATFGELLGAHLDKQKFNTEAMGKGMERLLPLGAGVGDAYVWYWPPPALILTLLRKIPALDEIVALQRFGTKTDAQVKKVHDDKNSAAWLADLRKFLGNELHPDPDASPKVVPRLTKAELNAYLEKVKRFFVERQETAQTELQPLFHTAARIDRQVLARKIGVELRRYAKDRLLAGIAHQQAEAIQRAYLQWQALFFADVKTTKDASGHESHSIGPTAHSRLHLAALLLELTPDLEIAFEKIRFGTIVGEYLGLMDAGHESAVALRKLDRKGRASYLPLEQATDSWLDERIPRLRALVEKFRAFHESVQRSAGYRADKTAGVLHVTMKFTDPLPVNTTLYPRTGYGLLGGETTGEAFRITAIRRDFIYHPAFGEQSTRSDRLPSGYGAPEFLEPDGLRPLALKPGEKLFQVEELDAKENVKRTFDVGAEPADQLIMAKLYQGAVYWAFGTSMANVQKAIEKYVETLVDIAELIPGWGKFITAGKIAIAIADFWTSDVYKDLLRVVNGDVEEMIQALVTKFSEIAQPGAMLELLMFGSPFLDEALSKSTQLGSAKSDKLAAKRPSETRGRFGALKQTFVALKKLGLAFARALGRLRDKVQQPMQDTREFVSTRPTLSFAMHFAAAHVFELMEAAKKLSVILAMLSEGEHKDVDLKDSLQRALGVEQKGFGPRIREMMGRLSRLELPARLIDISPAVQFILDELVVFVGGRLGIQGKAVVTVLKGSGLLDLFTSRVADAIVSYGVDPNVLWRDKVIPQIAERFTETRDSLVKSLNDLLQSDAFHGTFTPIDKGPALTLEPNQDDPYQELQTPQPLPATDRELTPHPEVIPAVGKGQPLPAHTRAAFESGFGQDFSHVRVHLGGSGEAMTQAFGAEALTSGSHVFLRGGLDPARGFGEEVMGHELAHVVQQTGDRPLGRAYPAAPTPARPERGLSFDPASEADAHRMAKSVKTLMPGGRLSAGVAAREGMSPYTVENLDPYVLQRILRAFNKLEAIKAREVELDKDAGNRKPYRTEDTQAVEATATSILNIAKKSSTMKVGAPKVFQGLIEFDHVLKKSKGTPVLDRILLELNKGLKPDHFTKVAHEIAVRAQDAMPEEVPQGGAKLVPKREQYVNPSHFARQLEGYILGKTGIALALNLKTREFKAPNGKQLTEIDPAAPIQSVDVLHIYLPYLAPNTELAKFAIRNTWPAASDDKTYGRLSGIVRGQLAALGIRSTVWALFGDTYKFSVIFKRDVDQMMAAKFVHGGALDPDQLTAPSEYADPAGKTLIGTRLGTYEDPNQQGGGRHSHHLTQFLVAEYFANKNDTKKPFHKGRSLPGVKRSGDPKDSDRVISIAANPTQQDKGILVDATFGSASGRGNKMPAISLAASTHQSGDLHITPGPDDLEKTVQKTQAFAVDRMFRRKLPEGLREGDSDTKFNTYRKGKTDQAIATVIHTAVIETYQFWAAHMNKRLVENVPRLEVAYYVALAANHNKEAAVKIVATSPTEEGKLKDLIRNTAEKATQHNLDEMAKYNWTKP